MSRFWTAQGARAWARAEAAGVLRCAGCYAPEYRAAYAWMRGELTARLGPPPAPDQWALWAWDSPQPLAYLPPRTRAVLVAFEAEPRELLASGFVAWHAVLNDGPLLGDPPCYPGDPDRTVAAVKAWDAEWEAIHADPARRRASWARVFDRAAWSPGETAQYTFWELPLARVVRAAPAVVWRREGLRA